jgi:hypothetical protein
LSKRDDATAVSVIWAKDVAARHVTAQERLTR